MASTALAGDFAAVEMGAGTEAANGFSAVGAGDCGVTGQAEGLGTQVKEDLARKTDSSTENRHAGLTLDKAAIELDAGARTDVTVSRTGDDLKMLQLGLLPSSGSNLLVSGGLFNAGETSTSITVEAPKTARSGRITIEAGNNAAFLAVSVKP